MATTPTTPNTPRHGAIHWIESFPPLDGGQPKRRMAIFIDLEDLPPTGTPPRLIFVAITTEPPDHARDPDAVRLARVFPRESWALPRWIREIPPEHVGEFVRMLPLVLQTNLDEAVVDRFFDYPDPGGE